MDDDCDGLADEGFRLGQACTVGEGDRCAGEGRLQCTGPHTSACIPINRNDNPEECNNLDDDCDGRIDEGNPGGSDQECSTGPVGACQLGTYQCVEGAMSCEPMVLVGATPEVCDGIDNDCDSFTDEAAGGSPIDRDCYYGPPATKGVGVCVAGSQDCIYGNWGLCTGMVTPSDEVCDGLDNNCDGLIDNVAGGGNCFCCPLATQDCYGGGAASLDAMGDPRSPCAAGTQSCGGDGRWGECAGLVAPGVEQCNNTDDDCDGTTDEDVPGAGTACHAGVGACRRDGVMACSGGSLGCSASPGSPASETCNGIDDDCNGLVDDGDAETFGLLLGDLVRDVMSCYDFDGRAPEWVYHAFLAGLLVNLAPHHEVRSNRESGYGRYDVMVLPRTPGQPGAVMELKALRGKDTVPQALEKAARQLVDRQYATELRARGADPIQGFAVVFDGKQVHVESVEV